MKRNILICGDIGVGKSTLIRRLLTETQLDSGGFCTKKEISPGGYLSPVYIYPADIAEDARTRGAENLVGMCDPCGCREMHPEVFDALGVDYLQKTMGREVIVMDELGFMESTAPNFCQAVLAALDGDTPVLAAVKNRADVAFLQQVLTHPKGAVYRITPENREELFHELLPIVREWKK